MYIQTCLVGFPLMKDEWNKLCHHLHVAVQLQVSTDPHGGVWDHGNLVLANLWDGIWAMLTQA